MKGVKDIISMDQKKDILKYFDEKYFNKGYIKKISRYFNREYFEESYIKEIMRLLDSKD